MYVAFILDNAMMSNSTGYIPSVLIPFERILLLLTEQ